MTVDGTPGANDMPAQMSFDTTADGAASPTQRMTLGPTGILNLLDNVLAKGIGFDMWLGNANSYKDAMDYASERASLGSMVHALCMYLIWGETIDCRDGFLHED